MSEPLPSINDPFADLGHEGIRVAVVQAIAQVTARIDLLQGQFVAAQQNLTATAQGLAAQQAALAALTDRVTALETPVVPGP